MNSYYVVEDGECSGILCSNEPIDNINFLSFEDAKNKLIKIFNYWITQYREALDYADGLTPERIFDGEKTSERLERNINE